MKRYYGKNMRKGKRPTACSMDVAMVDGKMRRRCLEALGRLTQLYEAERRYREAGAHVRRLLQLDPLHEASYRQLMRLHALDGDRATALHVYHSCVTALQRELGVEPSPATRELYERLLGSDLPEPRHTGEAGEGGVVEALDELWQRRIVREQGVNLYDFGHDRIREVASVTVSPVRRAHLHRRVAGALEAIHAADLDSVSAQLAFHHERSGATETAVSYYRRASRVAARVYANEEVIRLSTRGLQRLWTLAALA